MKTKWIYLNCNNFYKEASLSSDMAARILFPLSSKETFDFITGRIAAKGAIDVLFYGAKTVTAELDYYPSLGREKISIFEIDRLLRNRPVKKNIANYIKILKLATELFRKKGKWSLGFGGEAWAQISNTLYEVAIWYEKYLNAEKYSDDEEQAIRRIIIYMNKFDGLAHNSGTIYNKMITHELINTGEDERNYQKNLKTIEKLRDMSESKNTGDIVREVSPHLDIELPFKDYLSKIRRTEEYRSHDPKRIEKHLENVQERKQVKNNINDFIFNIKEIMKSAESLIKYTEEDFLGWFKNKKFIDDAKYTLSTVTPAVWHIYERIVVDFLQREVPINYLKKSLRNDPQAVEQINHYLEILTPHLFLIKQIMDASALNVINILEKIQRHISVKNPPALEEFNILEPALQKFIIDSKKALSNIPKVIEILNFIKESI